MWPFSSKVPDCPTPPPPPKTYLDGEFDIEGVKVISVERDRVRDITLVCFLEDREEGGINTRVMLVSPAKHDDLVRRFRAKIGLGITVPIGQPPSPIPHT